MFVAADPVLAEEYALTYQYCCVTLNATILIGYDNDTRAWKITREMFLSESEVNRLLSGPPTGAAGRELRYRRSG